MPRASLPDNAPFFSPANHVGAFGRSNWTLGWTALDNLGYNGNIRTGIEDVTAELPTGISLHQNYPNPFNPETTIEFGIAHTQHVRLAVYDVLGRQVRLLHEGSTRAGTFRLTFNGQGLASGLYFYRLETAAGSLTHKMTLVK